MKKKSIPPWQLVEGNLYIVEDVFRKGVTARVIHNKTDYVILDKTTIMVLEKIGNRYDDAYIVLIGKHKALLYCGDLFFYEIEEK
jgi:hypothetical protein